MQFENYLKNCIRSIFFYCIFRVWHWVSFEICSEILFYLRFLLAYTYGYRFKNRIILYNVIFQSLTEYSWKNYSCNNRLIPTTTNLDWYSSYKTISFSYTNIMESHWSTNNLKKINMIKNLKIAHRNNFNKKTLKRKVHTHSKLKK